MGAEAAYDVADADHSGLGALYQDRDIEQTIRSVRRHLGMEVAFVCRFVGDRRIFQIVDGDLDPAPIRAGESSPLDDSYCRKVMAGRLPQLIHDAAEHPEALVLPGTVSLPVGSHFSVPLVFSDGRVYGTFCCFSRSVDRSLTARDLGTVSAIAEIIAHRIETEENTRRDTTDKRKRIETLLAGGGPTIHYQPIVLLADRRVVGVEALSRFEGEPRRAPDVWFTEATEVGMLVELETMAIRNAIEGWRPIWRQSRLQLGLNCSAQTLIDGRLNEILEDVPLDRIVIELTEHDPIDDYFELGKALASLRAGGVRLAIDDAGAGYATMRHILNTQPDIMKLDISLTKNIDTDSMRRALAAAFVRFAEGFEGKVVAEGVEREAELDALRALGIQAAQGYHIARPMPIEAFREFLFRR